MHAEDTQAERHDVAAPPPSRPIRLFRSAYTSLAWLLVACVVVQVYLAGMAIFVDAGYWARHTGFVHLFEAIPILLLVLAFAGRMPKGRGYFLWPLLLWLLIGTQYAFAEAGGSAVAALHPVNALAIFSGSLLLARRAWDAGGVRLGGRG